MRLLIFKRFQSGQSIIEAVVSVAVVSLIIVTLVSAVTVSVRNATFSKNKTLANKYVTEGLEAVRSIKEKSWTDLESAVGTIDLVSHGIAKRINPDTEQPEWYFTAELSDNPTPAFTRTITVSGVGVDTISVEVKVTWIYGTKDFSSSATTNFTKWIQ